MFTILPKPEQADYFETQLIEYKLHFERYNEKKRRSIGLLFWNKARG